MIKVTFLNVGQGDSIVLEWIDENQKNIVGIIDSNKTNTGNPTINFLETIKFDHIKFIILSHPHSDHFSGILNLLNYCEKNLIKVKYFSHTSIIKAEYFNSCFKDNISTTEFINLFTKLKKMDLENNIVCNAVNVGLCDTIPLNADLYLKFLSPSKVEQDRFINNENYNDLHEEEAGSNPQANALSTIIKIYSNSWYILLTADSDKPSFLRILKKQNSEISQKMVLGQGPHHGSKLNFAHLFWQKIIKEDETPIVISVGKNGYGHPNLDVIKKFENLKFNVTTTTSIFDINNSVSPIQKALGVFSKPYQSESSTNKSFLIDKTGLLKTL